jgi:hypothetical protein
MQLYYIIEVIYDLYKIRVSNGHGNVDTLIKST